MASDPDFVRFVVDHMAGAGAVSCRMMFGGHTIYCDGKVVALICENQLFVKPTEAGRAFIGNVVEAPPYPGAKHSFLIEEQVEDGEWLSRLVWLTARELPKPRAKNKRKRKGKR